VRCSPDDGRKLGGPVGDVRLGYSFFENVGCTPEDRPHLANECALLTESGVPSDLHPGPRALDGTRAVRVDLTVRRVAVRVVYAARSRRERRVTAAFRANGRGASGTLLRTAKPSAGGGCPGQSGSDGPLRRFRSEPPSSKERRRAVPDSPTGSARDRRRRSGFLSRRRRWSARTWRLPPCPSPSLGET
jgi:hypothetical protein